MPRRVFFSFHYADIMNANIVRMSGQFKPTKETGFYDASLWEEAKLKGEAAIKRLIRPTSCGSEGSVWADRLVSASPRPSPVRSRSTARVPAMTSR